MVIDAFVLVVVILINVFSLRNNSKWDANVRTILV